MHYILLDKKNEQAVNYFEKAVVLEPSSVQYIYAQVLSLDTVGQTQVALNKLKTNIKVATTTQQLK